MADRLHRHRATDRPGQNLRRRGHDHHQGRLGRSLVRTWAGREADQFDRGNQRLYGRGCTGTTPPSCVIAVRTKLPVVDGECMRDFRRARQLRIARRHYIPLDYRLASPGPSKEWVGDGGSLSLAGALDPEAPVTARYAISRRPTQPPRPRLQQKHAACITIPYRTVPAESPGGTPPHPCRRHTQPFRPPLLSSPPASHARFLFSRSGFACFAFCSLFNPLFFGPRASLYLSCCLCLFSAGLLVTASDYVLSAIGSGTTTASLDS